MVWKIKCCTVRNAIKILSSLLLSRKLFMKRVFFMTRRVVLHAARREKLEEMLPVRPIESIVRPMRLSAPNAVVQPRCLLSLEKTGLFTAGNAIFKRNSRVTDAKGFCQH